MSELTFREQLDRVVQMLDPAFDWEAYYDADSNADSDKEAFRKCIIPGFPEDSESEHYIECGSSEVENTPDALYRLLYLVQPKEPLDFSSMYKGFLFGFFSADKRFLVAVHFFKYEIGLYFYAPRETIAGKGYGVVAGHPGADNGWRLVDEDGKAFFEMIVKAANHTWEVYPGNSFEV